MTDERTRAGAPPGHHVIVYDAGCRSCSTAAGWLVRHAQTPVEPVPLEEAHRRGLLTTLSPDEVASSAHHVDPDGVEMHGGAAMASLLRLLPGGRLARLLELPGVAWLRDRGYVRTAHRHR